MTLHAADASGVPDVASPRAPGSASGGMPDGGLGGTRRGFAPVWLVAPVGRDAKLLRQGLLACVDDVRIADGAGALRHAFSCIDEVGVLVLTQEALTGDVMEVLGNHLETQPPWSELPILLLVDPTGNTAHELARFQAALPRSRTLVLQRPVRVSELESAVLTMCRSRSRQFTVRDHVRRQEVLRRELNHRVKNILATVQALHLLTASGVEDLDAFSEIFEGRLEAMADVHQVFHDADYTTSDLVTVVGAIVHPYREAGRLAFDGTRVVVGPEVAQDLALVVHELLTNAAKYGALSVERGRVEVSWRRDDDAFVLDWAERDGPTVRSPERSGYGTRFIDMMMRGRGGTARFDYRPEGVRVVLEAPLRTLEAER